MSGTIGSSNAVFSNPTLLKELTDLKEQRVGMGSGAGVTHAPPVSDKMLIGALVGSLSAFMSDDAAIGENAVTSGNAFMGDVEVLLVVLAVTMRDAEATSEKSKINTDQETKKAESKDKERKLAEAAKKLEEAESKKNSSSVLDKIKLAFEWIGALLAVVAAAALIATGVGAFVGAMLIGAAATSLIMATDSTVQMATGKGIAGNIAKLCGASDEEAAKADMGFRISMAVIGIAFALAGGGASIANAGRAGASAGMEGAKTGSKIAQGVKDVLNTARAGGAESAKISAKMAGEASNVANAATSAGAAGVDAGRAAVNYQATNLSAQAKDLQAEAKKLEAMMGMLDDMIDQALTRLVAAGDRFNAILDAIMEGVNDRQQALSKTRFG